MRRSPYRSVYTSSFKGETVR